MREDERERTSQPPPPPPHASMRPCVRLSVFNGTPAYERWEWKNNGACWGPVPIMICLQIQASRDVRRETCTTAHVSGLGETPNDWLMRRFFVTRFYGVVDMLDIQQARAPCTLLRRCCAVLCCLAARERAGVSQKFCTFVHLGVLLPYCCTGVLSCTGCTGLKDVGAGFL